MEFASDREMTDTLDMSAPRAPSTSLAIALSGGGHRATIFGLGALMYVVDAGRHRQTTSISSVSGGSLTNGFVGKTLDFHQTTTDEFTREVAGPLAHQVAQRGTLFAPWTTKLYLLVLVLVAVAVVAPFVLLSTALWIQIVAALGVLIVLGWLFSMRGRVCALAFRKTLFAPDAPATRLNELRTAVAHVICATELRTAQRVYFSGKFIYAWWFGHGQPGTVTLARAVQASAAFPGGFPPARLATRSIGFADGHHGSRPAATPRSLIMSDGGVYDNMGDQWATGFRDRMEVWPWLKANRTPPDQLVVVNASARQDWSPFHWGRFPWLGEVLALKRVNDVMYVNTTNVRRQNIVGSFNPVRPDEAGPLPGALVQIAQSPFVVAKAFRHSSDPGVALRAEEVIKALGGAAEEETWRRITTENAAVATTLHKLGAAVSARLMYHAYVLTMCNLYVVFGPDRGWSLAAIPDRERFERIAKDGKAA